MDQDWFPLLDLLSIVFNPMSRYRSHLSSSHSHIRVAWNSNRCFCGFTCLP